MGGLQIQRYECPLNSVVKDGLGQYCLFSEAKKFHSAAQEALGKNMILTVENKRYRIALNLIKESDDIKEAHRAVNAAL